MTQVGNRIPGMLYLKVCSKVSEAVKFSDDLDGFLNYFNSELHHMSSGNNTSASGSYRAVRECQHVQIWKIGCDGDKQRVIYTVYKV